MSDDTRFTISDNLTEESLLKDIQNLSNSVGNLIDGISKIIPEKVDASQLIEIISRSFEQEHGFRPEVAREIAELLAGKILERRNTNKEG